MSRLRSLPFFAVALASLAFAQVNVRFTPEPMTVPTSVLANAHDLGRWKIVACNDGAAPVTFGLERIDMAAGALRLIGPDDAMLVLTSHAKRSVAGTILHVVSLAGQGVAIGVSVAGTIKNPTATAAIGIGSGLLPQLQTILKGEVPSAVSLQSLVKYPVTLTPGACMTDYQFAAKAKNPQVFSGVIK